MFALPGVSAGRVGDEARRAPGIAVARALTAAQTPGGMFVIPWTLLLVIGILVPTVAAALAAAGIRRAPTVTRRAG